MKNILCISIGLLLLSAAAWAQDDEQKATGYVFAAPGVQSGEGFHQSILQIGGGVDVPIAGSFNLGGDIGYHFPMKEFRAGVGILDANGTYRFKTKKAFEPFITGGYSLMFRGEHANGGNFGAGATWWASEHQGLRFEARDQFFRANNEPLNVFTVRVAWAFR